MELGPLQKRWVQTLRAYPERQLTGSLGNFEWEDGEINYCDYRACCLGQAQILLHEGELDKFLDGTTLINEDQNDGVLGENDWQKYRLRSKVGTLQKSVKIGGQIFSDLADMNDESMTWPEIADYIEQHPENVFTEPA